MSVPVAELEVQEDFCYVQVRLCVCVCAWSLCVGLNVCVFVCEMK